MPISLRDHCNKVSSCLPRPAGAPQPWRKVLTVLLCVPQHPKVAPSVCFPGATIAA